MKDNKKIHKAILGSIKKWKLIEIGEWEDLGWKNCPLCNLFLFALLPCFGCPVREKTGKSWCKGSPYVEWMNYIKKAADNGDIEDFRVFDKKSKKLAKAERQFLEKLLIDYDNKKS